MKRRSTDRNKPPSFTDDANVGWCNFVGQNFPRDVSADAVVSSFSTTNETNRVVPADVLPYDPNGTPGRNSKTLKKSRRRSSKSAGSDKNRNGSNDSSDLSSLIASELLKLSIEDRTKALEEVHGVVENIEEDPEEINKLFEQVKEELKRIRYKQAYEKAAFLSGTYVNDPEFVLPFIRSDNYNPRPAAMRLAEHFKHKLELFGEHTLVRDIMYDDLCEKEKMILNSGFVQTSPASDRAGRKVVVCNMSEFLKIGTLRNILRAMWYLMFRNAQLESTITKTGVVAVYFTHKMVNIFEKLFNDPLAHRTGFMQHALPFKLASVHFCFDNTFGSTIQRIVMMSLGKYARIRLRSHCGSRMECSYALKSFGIDIEPFETNGLFSLSDSVKEEINRFREMDKKQQEKAEARVLPRPNDVLLGRGRPFQLYSGNLALGAKIDQNRSRYTKAKKMDKKIITSEIVQSIHKCGGRFLKKANNETGNDVDWEEVGFETARLKVSHSFRTNSKCHSENEDTWNNSGNVGEEMLGDSNQFLTSEGTDSLGSFVESSPSNPASLPNGTNYTLSKKRRKA